MAHRHDSHYGLSSAREGRARRVTWAEKPKLIRKMRLLTKLREGTGFAPFFPSVFVTFEYVSVLQRWVLVTPSSADVLPWLLGNFLS